MKNKKELEKRQRKEQQKKQRVQKQVKETLKKRQQEQAKQAALKWDKEEANRVFKTQQEWAAHVNLEDARNDLHTAALLRKLPPTITKASRHINKALKIVSQLQNKDKGHWPEKAIDHAQKARTILNQYPTLDEEIVIDHIRVARDSCERAGKALEKTLERTVFKNVARDPAKAMTFFGQRPDWSRVGVPLNKPLKLKPEKTIKTVDKEPKKRKFSAFTDMKKGRDRGGHDTDRDRKR